MKTLTIAGGLLAASLSFAPQQASAAALGGTAELGAAFGSPVETVQYGYGYGRGYYGPRRGYRRGFYGPGYGRRRFYRRRFGY